ACRRIDAKDLTVGGIGNVQHTPRADRTAEAYRVEGRQQGGSGRRRGCGRCARRSDAEGELEDAQECYSQERCRVISTRFVCVSTLHDDFFSWFVVAFTPALASHAVTRRDKRCHPVQQEKPVEVTLESEESGLEARGKDEGANPTR